MKGKDRKSTNCNMAMPAASLKSALNFLYFALVVPGRGLKKGHPQVAMAIQKSEEDLGIETRDPMQMTQGQGPRYFLFYSAT